MTLIDKSGWYLIGVNSNESIQTAVDNMTGSGYKAIVTKASLVKSHITSGSNRNSPHPFEPEDWEVVSDTSFNTSLIGVYPIISSGSLGVWVYASVVDSYTVTFVYTDSGSSNILGDLVVKFDMNGVGYNSVKAPPVFSGNNAKISVNVNSTYTEEYIEYTTTNLPVELTIVEYTGMSAGPSPSTSSVLANYDDTFFTLTYKNTNAFDENDVTIGDTIVISLKS